MSKVTLRPVLEADLPTIFQHQLDPDANHMAAFTARDPSDRDAFMAHWAKILADDTIVKRAILWQGKVAGNIGSFLWDGTREISYWIGTEYWGKGIATSALAQFLQIVEERPLYAHAAADNLGSIRVLEKCGFKVVGRERSFAPARGEEIEEVVLVLD